MDDLDDEGLELLDDIVNNHLKVRAAPCPRASAPPGPPPRPAPAPRGRRVQRRPEAHGGLARGSNA